MTIAKTMTALDLKLEPPPDLTPEQRRAWDAYYEPRNAAFRAAHLEGNDLVRWKYQRYMHDYLGCIKAVDESVGRLARISGRRRARQATPWSSMQPIRASISVNMAGSTSVGSSRSRYGLRSWCAGRASPKPGVVNANLVSNIDFAETILEAAGLPIPQDMQGRSFVPILKGQIPQDWRKTFYYQYFEYPVPHHVRPHYGVVTDRYKLVHFDTPDLDEWELFDLEKDPHELRNVYGDPAYVTVVAGLKRELDHLRAELKVPVHPPREAYGQVVETNQGEAPPVAAGAWQRTLTSCGWLPRTSARSSVATVQPRSKVPISIVSAGMGVRYTRAYTTAPVCSASRSAFMTGMYQTRSAPTTIGRTATTDIGYRPACG